MSDLTNKSYELVGINDAYKLVRIHGVGELVVINDADKLVRIHGVGELVGINDQDFERFKKPDLTDFKTKTFVDISRYKL
jgi:hypothetical protein